MAYGSPHASAMPTPGVTADLTAAQQINAAILELRSTVDAKVTPAGININAALSYQSGATNYPATGLAYAGFYANPSVLAPATFPLALYTSGGELYYHDASSRRIQVTLNGALNTAASGAITGTGYGTGGVEVNWDAANLAFRMRAGAATDAFADVVCDDVVLNDGSGNTVRMTVPSLAADYTLTLPTAVPASGNNVLQMSAAGALSVATAPTVASMTLATDGNLTLQGTGKVVHGEYTRTIPALAGQLVNADLTDSYWNDTHGAFRNQATTDIFMIPITLYGGERLKSVEAYIGNAVGGGTVTMEIVSVGLSVAGNSATDTSLGTASGNATANDLQTISVTGLTASALTATYYVAKFTFASNTNLNVYKINVTTDSI